MLLVGNQIGNCAIALVVTIVVIINKEMVLEKFLYLYAIHIFFFTLMNMARFVKFMEFFSTNFSMVLYFNNTVAAVRILYIISSVHKCRGWKFQNLVDTFAHDKRAIFVIWTLSISRLQPVQHSYNILASYRKWAHFGMLI